MSIKEILSKSDGLNENYTDVFERKGCCYSFLNPYGYNLMRKNASAFEKLDGVFFDGILLCFFYNLFYGKRVIRKSFDMTTVGKDLFNYVSTSAKTIYFIGAKENEVEKACEKYKEYFPNLNIAGFRNGYFSSDEERDSVIDGIISLNPDFVIVGMGAIIQEEFVVDLKEKGFNGISFTCGGFIHQTSDKLHYFPDWANRLHMRSFYRLYKEKATRKRFSKTIFDFPYNFVKDKFF